MVLGDDVNNSTATHCESSKYGTNPLWLTTEILTELKFKKEAKVMCNWDELHRNNIKILPGYAGMDVRKAKA